MFCATKSTADFIRHLIFLDEWVIANVPDGRFRVLRMDFGSEAARQNHGEDFIVTGLTRVLADTPAHPGRPGRPSRIGLPQG